MRVHLQPVWCPSSSSPSPVSEPPSYPWVFFYQRRHARRVGSASERVVPHWCGRFSMKVFLCHNYRGETPSTTQESQLFCVPLLLFRHHSSPARGTTLPENEMAPRSRLATFGPPLIAASGGEIRHSRGGNDELKGAGVREHLRHTMVQVPRTRRTVLFPFSKKSPGSLLSKSSNLLKVNRVALNTEKSSIVQTPFNRLEVTVHM